MWVLRPQYGVGVHRVFDSGILLIGNAHVLKTNQNVGHRIVEYDGNPANQLPVVREELGPLVSSSFPPYELEGSRVYKAGHVQPGVRVGHTPQPELRRILIPLTVYNDVGS